MKVTFGTPEVLFGLSVVLMTNSMMTIGWTFFGMAVLGTVFRFGLDHAEKLEREKKNTELEKDLKRMIETAGAQKDITYPHIVH